MSQLSSYAIIRALQVLPGFPSYVGYAHGIAIPLINGTQFHVTYSDDWVSCCWCAGEDRDEAGRRKEARGTRL